MSYQIYVAASAEDRLVELDIVNSFLQAKRSLKGALSALQTKGYGRIFFINEDGTKEWVYSITSDGIEHIRRNFNHVLKG